MSKELWTNIEIICTSGLLLAGGDIELATVRVWMHLHGGVKHFATLFGSYGKPSTAPGWFIITDARCCRVSQCFVSFFLYFLSFIGSIGCSFWFAYCLLTLHCQYAVCTLCKSKIQYSDTVFEICTGFFQSAKGIMRVENRFAWTQNLILYSI